MNISERIVLLQEELKFEDERQEVLYAEFHGLCDPWPDNLEKVLSSDERQELVTLNEARKREEAEALAIRPGFLTWKSAEETETNLSTFLHNLRKTNNIVERIIKILKKATE